MKIPKVFLAIVAAALCAVSHEAKAERISQDPAFSPNIPNGVVDYHYVWHGCSSGAASEVAIVGNLTGVTEETDNIAGTSRGVKVFDYINKYIDCDGSATYKAHSRYTDLNGTCTYSWNWTRTGNPPSSYSESGSDPGCVYYDGITANCGDESSLITTTYSGATWTVTCKYAPFPWLYYYYAADWVDCSTFRYQNAVYGWSAYYELSVQGYNIPNDVLLNLPTPGPIGIGGGSTTEPLEVAIINPPDGAVFPAPANVTIDVAVSGGTPPMQSVTIYEGANVVGTANALANGLYEFVWNNVPLGSHTLTAKAVDSTGNMATSQSITIQIKIQNKLGQSVAAGQSHTVLAKRDGTVWAWGSNAYGQIGDGSATTRLSPVQVTVSPGVALSDVVSVGCGTYHSLAAKSDGTVWAWGYNNYGQLGDGTTSTKYRATQIPSLTGIVAVAGGLSHSIALRSDGSVWAWGYNYDGELGDGTTINRLTPAKVNGLSEIIAIASGDSFCIALKSDGTVWTWGMNSLGQLGIGSGISYSASPVQVTAVSGIVGIAAGKTHAVVVKNDETVSTWGGNMYGQLGDGTHLPHRSPFSVPGINGIVAVSGGRGYHTLALKSDGTCWAWGGNLFGQIGDGTTTHQLTPVMIALSGVGAVAGGEYHSISLQQDGTVYSWGRGGTLGDGTQISHITPAIIPGFTY